MGNKKKSHIANTSEKCTQKPGQLTSSILKEGSLFCRNNKLCKHKVGTKPTAKGKTKGEEGPGRGSGTISLPFPRSKESREKQLPLPGDRVKKLILLTLLAGVHLTYKRYSGTLLYRPGEVARHVWSSAVGSLRERPIAPSSYVSKGSGSLLFTCFLAPLLL